jgi:hypothetical protein
MLTCEDCGETSDDVEETLDPLAESKGEQVEVTLCPDCLETRESEAEDKN